MSFSFRYDLAHLSVHKIGSPVWPQLSHGYTERTENGV